MPARRRRPEAALLVLALLAASGCGVFECPDLGDVRDVRVAVAALAVEAPADGPVTVALVEASYGPEVRFYVRAGAGALPYAPPAGTAEVVYGLDGRTYAEAPPALASVTRGDTVFVYVEGAVDPSVFVEACSPATEAFEIQVEGAAVAEAVTGVTFTVVRFDDLAPSARSLLHQHDAGRSARRTVTV